MPTIKSYNKRLEALRSERSSFIPLYQELSDYHLAHRGRFLTSDRNKGHKRNTRQINNTSRLASRTLASGMMSGITSPARPWFRLSSGDKSMDDLAAVKSWLHAVQKVMYRVFSSSNTYNSLHTLYAEMGVFGIGAIGVFKDFDNVIWCRPYTVGSYMIGANGKNTIDTFYREYEYTVSQVVKEFGIDNCSNSVKEQWKKGNTEAWIKLVHAIEPNDDRDSNSPLASEKKFRSVYYEQSTARHRTEVSFEDKFLSRSGFDTFPVLTPRWDVTAEDIYAVDCPGITSIGDVKSMQLAERRKYQALDKVVNPPLQGPSSLKNKMKGGVLKGGEVVYHDETTEGLTSIYQNYRPDIPAIKEEILDAEQRISRAFYEDLFLMLAQTDRRQITAREVAEKHEEKLLMLGPVLERLHTELLDPLIDRTFDILQDVGVLPEPPPELQGKELNIEYVSVLAQAQRLVNTGAIDRLSQYTSQIAQVWPDARHKFNAIQSIDDYADALGVDPAIVNSDEVVEQMVQAERQAQAQAQAQEQAGALAHSAKLLSETDTGGDNALSGIMERAGLG